MKPAPYVITIQSSAVKPTRFFTLNATSKYIIITLSVVFFTGIAFFLSSILLFLHHESSYKYYTLQNASLKQELSQAVLKQQTLESELYSIRNIEQTLLLQYGLNEDQVFQQYAVGGTQSSQDLFIQLTNPLQQALSSIDSRTDALFFNIKSTLSHLKEIQSYAKYKKDIWQHTPSTMPAKGRFTSGFGYRIHPITGERAFHFGLDIAEQKWTPVRSTADGVVQSSSTSQTFGIFVEIDHGNGYSTKYAHLSKSLVKKGQLVKRYELIGYLGESGISTGPHLHYEVHRDKLARDPKTYILPEGVIVD